MEVGECLTSDSIENKSCEPVATSDQSSKLEVNLSSSGLTSFQPDCSFGNIVELNLSNNKLSRIPASVASLRRLQKLNCSENEITVAEEEEEFNFFKPKDVNKFVLNCPEDSIYGEDELGVGDGEDSQDSGIQDDLTSFQFYQLEKLSWVDLSRNKMARLPPGLFSLPSLTHLNLSHNRLTFLPDTFPSASQLVVLDCSWNCLTRLPVWLEQLTHCSRLELSGNPVELPKLPAQLGQNCRWLKYLAIQSMALREMPLPLTGLLNLRHLDLSNRALAGRASTTVKSSYFHTEQSCQSDRKVEDIEKDHRYMWKNTLWRIPAEIANLKSLVKLEAANVQLDSLPDSLGCLKSLKILELSLNNLYEIPNSFVELNNLYYCNISSNRMVTLPLDLELMSGLTHLLLASNKLHELPHQLHMLVRLETLDCYNNKLSAVPAGLALLPAIARLDLAANTFQAGEVEQELAGYSGLQAGLRNWDGRDPRLACENFTPDLRGLQGRLDMSPGTTVNIYQGGQEDEMEDVITFWSGLEERLGQEELCIDEAEEEEEVEEEEEEEEEDANEMGSDWEAELALHGYSTPPRISYKYDLTRMDREVWQGKERFCPADQHAAPRNPGAGWQKLGRVPPAPTARPRWSLLDTEGQFDDAD